jgi:putative membrane protein
MSVRVMGIVGLAVLLFAWAGPLPHLVAESFTAHMWLHMLVVGVAAPLIAAGLASRLAIPSTLALPIVISLLDFVVVWGWHAPALHHASRTDPLVLVAEQASFLAISFLVWLVALGGQNTEPLPSRSRGGVGGGGPSVIAAPPLPSIPSLKEGRDRAARMSGLATVSGNAALGGAMALFFTSMHMTLLGALLSLSPRPLYEGHHHDDGWLGLSPLADQQLGGVVMLAIGGVVYLCGGLVLMARVLRRAGV